ncbi:D-glycero-beta-D-manno-heptose 1-phosphate adenylyltransferase [Candidatus Dependentiae bacterium]
MKNIVNKIKLSGQKKVIVVGDIMLDEYIFGNVERISPEAPVLVLKEEKIDWSLGGAANVALNCKHIGCTVDLVGVINSNDNSGKKIISMLKENGIRPRGLIRSKNRSTTCKKRAMANNQQLLRIDTEDVYPLTKDEYKSALQIIKSIIEPNSIILISDYLKGVVTKELVEQIILFAKEKNSLVLVDPKGKTFDKYKGVNYIKPNYKEYCQILDYFNLLRSDSIINNGKKICEFLELNGLVVTLGEKGIQFVSQSNDIFIPACKKEVFDLTGAGDTVFAFLALGLVIDLPMKKCLNLANHAAAVAVSHLKTYAVSLDELIDKNIELSEKIYTNWALLKIELDWLRIEHKKIVFTNGCFDLLHSGHIHLLKEAKRKGDILVVAVNTDDSVKRFKGDQRPIKSLEERIKILSAINFVDFIVIFEQDTPKELIEYISPDILVKGGDYQKEKIAGYDFMIKSGGQVFIVEYQQGLATTNIVNKIKQSIM